MKSQPLFSDTLTASSPPGTRKSFAWLSTGSGPAFPPGTRCFPDPARPNPAAMERCAIARRGSPTSPRWVSTSCTFRRFIPSATPLEKAGTMKPPREPDDVGSPWAIGSEEGGHTSVDPKLGTLDDFDRLIAKAKEHRNRDRARLGFPVLARSPVCAATPGMVSQTSGRHDSVCGKSTQEISGHFPPRF